MPATAQASPEYCFYSDNTAGMAPEAMASLVAANAGSVASYGDDDWSRRARLQLRDVFQTECESFFVFNGTAANALALAQCSRSYQAVLCHSVSHVDTDECSAPEFFSGGSKVIPVSGQGGKLHPDDLAPVLRQDHGVHYPKPAVLSLTQSTEWGSVYTPEEISSLSAISRKHGMTLHMDGARFANAAAALGARGYTPADLTWRAGVDVLSLGGTKNGMHTTEAVIFFRPELVRDFDYRVKQGAQLASKQRLAAAQWCGMLEGEAWLRHAGHANAMAMALATELRKLDLRLIAEPEANGVFVELPATVAASLASKGWRILRFIGENGYRLMCSWATNRSQIDRLVADLRGALAANR